MSLPKSWSRVRPRPWLAAIPVLLTPLATAAAQAPPRSDQACRGDLNSAACLEARARELREPYRVRSIEEHRAAGDQVRRVYYAGYNKDLLLIAFVRPNGEDPFVSVHFPRRGSTEPEPPLRAALPWAVWEDILFRSRYFDRSLMPLPGGRTLCLHGGTYLVEATDPPRVREESTAPRRALARDCEESLAIQFAAELGRAALPLFPHCARLASRQHTSPSLQLRACRILRGDRMAAAEVMNAAEGFRAISSSWDAAGLASVLDERSRIDWNGVRNPPASNAPLFWVERAMPTTGVTGLDFETIEGESPGRVRLTGSLGRSIERSRGVDAAVETARVEQVWVRDRNGAFRVESATVGPWQPYQPRRAAAPTETNRDRRRR